MSSSARPATSRATGRLSGPRICYATSALLFARRLRERSTPGSWNADAGPGAFRFRGGVVTNDGLFCAPLAELGSGLAYASEPMATEPLRAGRLEIALERYAPT